MNARRIRAVARKEFLHILRDPRSLAIAIALPMLLLTLFGFALSFDVDNVPLVVWDQSGSPASREFVSRFTGSRYFSLRGAAWNYRDVENAIDTRHAMVALVIPADFAQLIEAGRIAPVQLIVDGSDSNTATIAMGYAEVVAQAYSQDVALRLTQRLGARMPDAPLALEPRVWFNADLESRNYIIPGLIAVIMMVIAALLTSLTVAREWERGTMEQLVSTPVRGPELIVGKLVPYFCIGIFDVLLAVIMAEFVFNVPFRGNLVLLFGIAAIFLIGVLALGIWVSVVTKNQALANQFAMILTFLPAYLLSGFMTPIANMPHALQMITYVVPARYFVEMIKGIYLKGVGLGTFALDALLLTSFSAAMVALAISAFRKKLE
jgi:ABC-2 type transport system permease protein